MLLNDTLHLFSRSIWLDLMFIVRYSVITSLTFTFDCFTVCCRRLVEQRTIFSNMNLSTSSQKSTYSTLGWRILSGFIRFFGSRTFFKDHMTCMAVCPTSSHSSALFPKPTPCSPVHVPSMARARLEEIPTTILHCKKYKSKNIYHFLEFLELWFAQLWYSQFKLIFYIISTGCCKG